MRELRAIHEAKRKESVQDQEEEKKMTGLNRTEPRRYLWGDMVDGLGLDGNLKVLEVNWVFGRWF